MKTLVKQKILTSVSGLFVLAYIMFASSCNKDFSNTLRENYPNDTTNIKEGKRKVLYLILDGVRGEVVDGMKPTNITLLTRNAVASYYSLADTQTNAIVNAAAWANMTTGVDYLKHNVQSNDFAGNNIVAYPSLFTRLKTAKPNLKTVSIAASEAFNTNLAVDASIKQNPANDVAVKDALVNELKNGDADVILGQFNSADIAAVNGGYETTNSAYTQAITTLDTYIGAIVKELKDRPAYAKENWLVVIASNKGGVTTTPGSADLGLFGDNRRNSFVLFYNPRFTSQELVKPDVYSFPFAGYAPSLIGFNGSQNTIVANNNTVANFGTSGNFTLMFKARFDNQPGNYPPIMGTQNVFDTSNNGWVIFVNSSGGWNFKVKNSTQFDGPADIKKAIFDGLWHTIAIQISTEGGARKMQAFQDGVLAGTKKTFSSDASNSRPFTLGNIDGSGAAISVLLRDVAVYNVAIPDAEIPGIMRKSGAKPGDPYYTNLQAYYPLDEKQGATFRDITGKTTGMTWQGTQLPTDFAEASKNISPPVSSAVYAASMNNVDIPVQIYYWLGVNPSSAWGLQGKVWKLQYTDVRK